MKISIALCTHNGDKFLQDLLDSISRQTTQPDEMIISDDASTDDTYGIIDDFQKSQAYPVSILTSSKTRGVNLNHDFALRQCTGDIIFVADQDDVWHDNKIELLSTYMYELNATAVFSNAELIDDSSDKIKGTLWQMDDIKYTKGENERALISRLLKSNVVTGSTIVLTQESLQQALPFPESDNYLYDEWIACALATLPNYSIVPFDEPTMKYRCHAGQFTVRNSRHVEGAFPYNWSAHFQPIEIRQSLMSSLASLLESNGVEDKEVNDCRNFWNLRLDNCLGFSILKKMHLSVKFLSGHYHRFVRRPFESWIKDVIAWPHNNSSR